MSESTVHLGENETQYICTIYGWFSGIEVEEVHEPIVRCRDCKGFKEDATPHDDTMPHFCSVLGIDLEDGDGFCKWARKRLQSANRLMPVCGSKLGINDD